MIRTHMQKGMGTAPFALVVALIVALTVGLWATQSAHADSHRMYLGVVVPDFTEDAETAGPTGRAFEVKVTLDADPGDTGTNTDISGVAGTGAADATTAADVAGTANLDALESAFAGASKTNVVRGEIGRGTPTWVTFRVGVSDGDDPAPEARYEITLSGEAVLVNKLTTGICAPATGTICTVRVNSTGTPGGFSIQASNVPESLGSYVAKGEPKLNGQFVGPATAATVLTAAPATTGIKYSADYGDETSTAADEVAKVRQRGTINTGAFGKISPTNFRVGAAPGLAAPAADTDPDNVGFLFQLTDRADQVAMNVDAGDRDAVLVTVTTDVGKAFNIAPELSNDEGSADDLVYVGIAQESGLADYPAEISGTSDAPGATGGLVAVGLTARTATDGGGTGRICVDVDADGTCEATRSFEVAGSIDGEMSSVSGIVSGEYGPVNLAEGDAHVRIITLRDKNGLAINSVTAAEANTVVVKDTSAADGDHLLFDFGKTAKAAFDEAKERTAAAVGTEGDADYVAAVDGADNPAMGAIASGKNGAYYLGISAETGTIGVHSFSVAIGTGNAKATKTVDADGNPLEAHIAGPITSLAVTSVTNAAGDEILSNGEITVQAYDLVTITLSATGKDGLAPVNASEVTPLSAAVGFVGVGTKADALKTDNAGEVSISYRAGTATQVVGFRAGSVPAQLLVRIADAEAAADTGPTVYTLATTAGGTFHTWDGGDASSAEFENVAGLVTVWKWQGNMWYGYVSNPAAPASTKTAYSLADGDILFVVANGPVTITLGD